MGWFAFITILLIAAASLFRAFRPTLRGPASPDETLYLIRSQQAFVIAVSTTFAANVVDLARHPSVWINSFSRNQLLTWLALYPAVASTMQLLVQSARRSAMQNSPMRLVALVAAGTIAILFVCPEYGIDYSSETAHILTVAVGALMILVPMRLLLPGLVPQESSEKHSGRAFLPRVGSGESWPSESRCLASHL